MKKRMLSLLLVLVMLLGLLPTAALAAPASGSGTAEDPYLISTAQELVDFRDEVNGSTKKSTSTLCAKLREWELPLCGAALRAESVDVKCVSLRRAAIAVGNEGRGLTDALLEKCDTKIILPMTPGSESLNAAVAASILMWEMWTQRG